MLFGFEDLWEALVVFNGGLYAIALPVILVWNFLVPVHGTYIESRLVTEMVIAASY